ncbi:phage virion morphogenesis protein, partial [Ectopseudomonas toyotomiensis]
GKGGEIGRQFVRKDKSNFAQDVKVGPYTINMPARPWLGTSPEDDEQILQRVLKYISQFSE